MVPQYELLATLTADKASRYEQEAAWMRLRARQPAVRHAAAVSLRRLADLLDGPPARLAAHGR